MNVDIEKIEALAKKSLGEWYELGELRHEDRSGYTHGLHHDDDNFITTTTPAAVLELINSGKRIASRLMCCPACQGEGEVYSGRNSYEGYNQPPEPIMNKCGECDGDGALGDTSECISILDELETLRAELAGLKTGYEAYERVNAELRAEVMQIAEVAEYFAGVAERRREEVEALRKDAERYQWFRNQHWDSSAICAVVDPKLTTKLGAYCPSGKLLDDAVDAGITMSKEQSHD